MHNKFLTNKKSKTCRDKYGKFLDEFNFESDAQDCANYMKRKFGRNLVPYLCEECGFWHLAPKCAVCGKAKRLYNSKKDAERQAAKVFATEGKYLRIYKSCGGWHLTESRGSKYYRQNRDVFMDALRKRF
ncbi:MAG: hypothetical protein K0U19_00730 [Proteobacteria bacterium]|nr:hypothetical protein [Pseudomonadota bacterium]